MKNKFCIGHEAAHKMAKRILHKSNDIVSHYVGVY